MRHGHSRRSGARDGLQNEAAGSPPPTRWLSSIIWAARAAIDRGHRVRQRVGATEADRGGVRGDPGGPAPTALVPNVSGPACPGGECAEVAISLPRPRRSAVNINQTIEQSLAGYRNVCLRAEQAGVRVRGYLSTAFGCPYEGAVAVARVVELSEALIAMGAFEVAVSDTIGVAHPGQVVEVVGALAVRVPLDRIALHFHDTRGTALANVLAALDLGVATFDASAGGLGGCPYAPGAAGNLATEDLIFMLDGLGIETGVDLAPQWSTPACCRVQDRTRATIALRARGAAGRSQT